MYTNVKILISLCKEYKRKKETKVHPRLFLTIPNSLTIKIQIDGSISYAYPNLGAMKKGGQGGKIWTKIGPFGVWSFRIVLGTPDFEAELHLCLP